MEAMTALYIVMFLITVLAIGIVWMVGKMRFGKDSDHFKSLLGSIKNLLRITSVVGLASLFLINTGKVPANAVSFLCIPFFIISASLSGTYFRLARHHATTCGKRGK